MSELQTRDLIRRYKEGDLALGQKLLACLLRERDEISGGLIGVWFMHSWRMERKADALGKRIRTRPHTRNERRFPEEEYTKVEWSDRVEGLSNGYYYEFPYEERPLDHHKMVAARACFQGDEHMLNAFDSATGIAIITPEMNELINSSRYVPGGDSSNDAMQNTLVGIAFAQAVKIIDVKDPNVTWWD